MRRMLWMLVLGCALALAGCDSDDNGGTGQDTTGGDVPGSSDVGQDAGGGADVGQPEDLATFLTFNAGLAYGYVLFAEERQPAIGPALRDTDADIVCLQEVWRPDDVQAIIDATKDTFPHSYWYDTTQLPNEPENGGEPACEEAKAQALRSCFDDNDCENDPAGLVACAQANCPDELGALSNGCLQCLVANLSKTVDEIFQACAEGSTLYLYDGANGLLLLSKWPFDANGETLLDSTFNRRSILHGRITKDTGTVLDVFCTHTTPEFDNTPYPGDFESWDAEQEHQIGQITSWVDETAQEGSVVVLMGDMNDGPAIAPDIEGELEDNYQMFLDAGFGDAYIQGEGSTPECTFCAANELNPADTRNALIDHIFVKGLEAPLYSSGFRVYADPSVQVTTDEGDKQVPLSDHYGVRAKVWRANVAE